MLFPAPSAELLEADRALKSARARIAVRRPLIPFLELYIYIYNMIEIEVVFYPIFEALCEVHVSRTSRERWSSRIRSSPSLRENLSRVREGTI